MTRFIASLIFLLCCTICTAQSKSAKTFYNKYDEVTDSVNSEYYAFNRQGIDPGATPSQYINSIPDTATSFFTKSGKLQSKKAYKGPYQNGAYVIWYENGNIREKGMFDMGISTPALSTWYPDGSVHTVHGLTNADNGIRSELISYYDSSGRQLIVNGNGFCRCYSTRGSIVIREEGKLVNNVKDGTWLTFQNNKLFVKELYAREGFKEGEWLNNGVAIRYTEYNIQPEFPGGLIAMQKYIQHNMHYPVSARKRREQGKVFVGFIVERDGAISGTEVIKGATTELDEEALRVVALMPKWKAGVANGKPVRVKFVVPINFLLPR